MRQQVKRRFKIYIELMSQSNICKTFKKVIPITHSKKYILGRSNKNSDIVLNDPSASRAHIEIKVINNQIWIRDLNTKNGTFVNSKNIINTSIDKGDMITIGSHIITITRIEKIFNNTEPTEQFIRPAFISSNDNNFEHTRTQILARKAG